jgi:putative SOS response-associated peptidase YedK
VCGRYAINASGQQLADTFELTLSGELERRYNVAPGQIAPVVREDEGGRALMPLRWGFDGGSTPGRTIINARLETAGERPSFRDALARRRCLVPATGFFEWRRQPSGRAPYYLQVIGAPIFAMAGLWSPLAQADATASRAFVVLTTEPNELVASIHDRMPVILPREAWATWLGPQLLSEDELRRLAQPIDAGRMSMVPVSSRVNSVRWDDALCIERVAPPPDQIRLF